MPVDRQAAVADIFAHAATLGPAVIRDDRAAAEMIRYEVHDLVDVYLDMLTTDIRKTLATLKG